MKYFIEEEGI